MPNEFDRIQKVIDNALEKFNKRIPVIQRKLMGQLNNEFRTLELRADRLAPSINNIRQIAGLRGKLLQLILNDDYKKSVTELVGVYEEITELQNRYFERINQNFRPSIVMREIKFQAIESTVNRLSENGIAGRISDEITQMLRNNVTTGGFYEDMVENIRASLTDTEATQGTMSRYAKQITTDALNQYSAQYTQLASGDLGYEWFIYQNSLRETSRCFCVAMVGRKFFHVSEIPEILQGKIGGKKMECDDGEKVALSSKTGLPKGMIEGTNESNFFTLRGGWNCNHQIRPVNELIVPIDTRTRVEATTAYKAWKRVNERLSIPQQ
jgi:hypothetical protein